MSPEDFGLDIWESMLLDGFYLSIKPTYTAMSREFEIDSLILKEFAKEEKLNFLWLVGTFKRLKAKLKKE